MGEAPRIEGADVRGPNAVGAVLVSAVLLCAAACTSGHKPSAKDTLPKATHTSSGSLPQPLAPYCAQLIAAAPKINAAQTALYSGNNPAQAVSTAVSQLTGLQQSAPTTDVKQAIVDMIKQFETARDILERPTMADRDRISVFGSKISTDNQTLTKYVAANCAS